MRHTSIIGTLSLVALLGACRDQGGGTPAVTPPPSAAASATASPPPAATATATADSTALMGTMFTRMADEAESRPTGTPTVEVVLAAFTAGGLPTEAGRQVLAATVKASYCWQSGTVDQALGFAVCEYESSAAAQAGAETSRVAGAQFGARTILVNGKTTITMKGTEAAIAKAKPIFEALK